ncbi:MAG TPA: outer membrane beta-barrel protein [Puia sp.]|jgi:hypothetical protein|nr:outer membrane beta-barrel protein [Puia sp.]
MKKKVSLFVAALFLLSTTTFAQKAYQQGSNVINAGIGLGATYWGSGYSNGVSLVGSYEHGVTDNISVGGILGYSHSSFSGTSNGVPFDYSATGILIGARGSYHFLTTDQIDPYAGADLGYIVVSSSNSNNNVTYSSAKGSGLGFGIHGGVRYYFNPGIGAFAELGIGSFYILALGVSFKF